MSVQCKPLPCEAQGPSSPCSHPGFVTVTRPRADDPCCPETVCGKTLRSRGARHRVTGDRAGAHQGPVGWAQESRGVSWRDRGRTTRQRWPPGALFSS